MKFFSEYYLHLAEHFFRRTIGQFKCSFTHIIDISKLGAFKKYTSTLSKNPDCVRMSTSLHDKWAIYANTDVQNKISRKFDKRCYSNSLYCGPCVLSLTDFQ